MRAILVISALAVAVYGRPEPPSGYQYPAQPSSRYGAPSGAGGFGQGGFRSLGGASGIGGGLGSSAGGSFGAGGSGFGANTGASAAASASATGVSGRSSGGNSAANGITVHKHVYVHVAPPEPEERQQPKARVILPPPQKHYKIIFVKAPTPPTPTVPDIPPIQQDEEKTLVYVLVKKPEEQPEIHIPTAAPTEPSKPEVYFIRYKAQNEDSGAHGGAGQDFSHIEDDTVEVGAVARGGSGGGAPHGTVSQSSASQAGGFAPHGTVSQSGASQAGGFATAFTSSSSASFRSPAGPSSQYGVPAARGPY